MKEHLVSFETAKLLSDMGFTDLIGTLRGKHYYNHRGELDGDVTAEIKHRQSEDRDKHKSIAAPPLSLAQQWLRETHGINLSIYFEYNRWVWRLNYNEDDECWIGGYETYEQALETGIIEGLKKIKL